MPHGHVARHRRTPSTRGVHVNTRTIAVIALILVIVVLALLLL